MDYSRRYRVQFAGGNVRLRKQKQAYIALPMAWVDEHCVEKGDYLMVRWRPDEVTIVVQLDESEMTENSRHAGT